MSTTSWSGHDVGDNGDNGDIGDDSDDGDGGDEGAQFTHEIGLPWDKKVNTCINGTISSGTRWVLAPLEKK